MPIFSTQGNEAQGYETHRSSRLQIDKYIDQQEQAMNNTDLKSNDSRVPCRSQTKQTMHEKNSAISPKKRNNQELIPFITPAIAISLNKNPSSPRTEAQRDQCSISDAKFVD